MNNILNLDALLCFSRAAYRNQLVYRVANWSGLFTNLFFLFIRAGVFMACYREINGEVSGLTLLQTMTYLTLTQSFFTLMPHLGNLGLSDDVVTGQISVELNRPMNYYLMFMAKRFGIFNFYLLYRFIPVIVVGITCGLLLPPQSLLAFILTIPSILMGFWISVSIMFLVESTAFWFQTDRGMKFCIYGFFTFFSGLLIPLNFFPDWAKLITSLLPFAYTYDAPVQIYLGTIGLWQMLGLLSYQLIWCLLLIFLCLRVLKNGARKVEIHGG